MLTHAQRVFDILHGRFTSMLGFEVSLPGFNLCAEGRHVHARGGRRGGRRNRNVKTWLKTRAGNASRLSRGGHVVLFPLFWTMLAACRRPSQGVQ